PNALTSIEIVQDPTQSGFTSDEAENKYYNYNLLLEGSFGSLGDPSVNLVYGTSENISTRFSWWSFGDYKIETIGIQPKYVLSTTHGQLENRLVTGVDLYYETLTVDMYGEAARLNRTRTTEIEKDTVGWYIHDEISIGGNIILSGGVRFESSETHGKLNDLITPANNFDKEKEHDGEVFDLSATWLPKDSMKLYTRFSRVYRYPFVDEQANYSGWGADDLNTDLEAEEGKSIEAGLEINPSQNFTYGLTLFNIDMEDEISLNPVTWVNDNMDDSRHRGLEMYLDYGLEDVFDLRVNYTYQESTFEAGLNIGNDIPLVPNNLFAASLDLTLPHNIHLIPSLKYVDDSYLSGDTNNNTEKLNDYTVVDLLLRYKKSFRNTQLTVFFKIANIFDEEYSTWGIDNAEWGFPNQFYPAPGRKFYGGISGTF
ncbi:MAG: TonB-dependent receptor, partial [Deltaproteobacteria bacterium]|nr:TonB-dependent receptor [Deltaproteobacteria bacterium]